MKPALKAPGTKRLKLTCDETLSNFAFNFKLRRYTKAGLAAAGSGGAAGGAENTAPPGSTGKPLRDRTSTGSAGSGGGGGGGLRMSETRMATRRRALKAGAYTRPLLSST
jgi:hypothetical protein